MAKMMKKLLALCLVLSLCMSFGLTALADIVTETKTVTNEDGTVTVIVTTTETTIDPETGEVTVKVTIEETTTSPEGADVKVEGSETCHETHVYDADGNELQYAWDNNGSETKEWKEEPPVDADLPDVTVDLVPGKTTTGSATSGPVEKTTGDESEGEGDTKYNYTDTTTTIDRTVTAESEAGKAEVNKSETDMECPVAPENYEGKQYSHAYDKDNPQSDGILYGGVMVDKGQGNAEEGYDYFLAGLGEVTDAAAPVFKHIVYQRDENGNPIPDGKGGYLIDEEKSKLIDGSNYAQGSEGGAKETGMDYQPGQLILLNEDGELYYAYCADYLVETDQVPGHWYRIENLEDSGYYSVEDAEKLRAIVLNGYWGTDAYVYETNEDGNILVDEDGDKIIKVDGEGNKVVDNTVTGSLESIKALLNEYAKENPTVTVPDKNGNPVEYNLATLIADLKEHEALAVTQAAIWAYSINRQDEKDGVDKVTVVGAQSAIKCFSSAGKPWSEYKPANDQSVIAGLTDAERAAREAAALASDARMQALFDCLMGLEGVPQSASGVSTVINEKNAVDSVSLTVKDKVAEDEKNLDEDETNDVYYADIDFTLAFIPGANDELYVCLMDENNQPIKDKDGKNIVRLLGNENKDGMIAPDANGVYTLTGLTLGENDDFTFDLKIEGTQHLNKGAYLYKAQGGRLASQTLVGIAEGEQEVSVSNSFTVSFSVDEEQTVVAEHYWADEGDPINESDPPEDPEEPPTEEIPPEDPPKEEKPPVEEPEPPVEIPEEYPPLEEIPEEYPPLADVPLTGDSVALWLVLAVLSALGLAVVSTLEKKKYMSK